MPHDTSYRQATPSGSFKELCKIGFLNLHPILIPVRAQVISTAQRSAQRHPQLRHGHCRNGHGDLRPQLLFQAKSLGKEASICTLTSDLPLGWSLGFPHWGHMFYLQCVYLDWHCFQEATSSLTLPRVMTRAIWFQPAPLNQDL